MTITIRNVTIKGVFAQNANTTIPEVPVAGLSYRDENTTQSEMEEGFLFKTAVDSSKFNEALHEYSAITKLLETYGFLPWSSLTDYEIGSVCLGTDGVVYQAKQATGPSSSAYDPVNDTTHTYWEILYTKDVVTINGDQTILGPKAFAGGLTVQQSVTPQVIVKNTSYTKGALPSSNISDSIIQLKDSANNNLASLYTRINTIGDLYIALAAYLNTAGVNTNAQLGITYKKDGAVTTSCPASDEVNSIVTTERISKGSDGYVKLGNGIIIQWGTASAANPVNITFPTAFSNTNYSVTAIQTSGSDNTSDVFVTNKSATGCKLTQKITKSVGYDWLAIGY